TNTRMLPTLRPRPRRRGTREDGLRTGKSRRPARRDAASILTRPRGLPRGHDAALPGVAFQRVRRESGCERVCVVKRLGPFLAVMTRSNSAFDFTPPLQDEQA